MSQGPFAEYPSSYTPRGEINFAVISEGFNIVTSNLGPFVVGGLLAIGLQYAVSIPFSFLMMAMIGPPTVNPNDPSEAFSYLGKEIPFIVVQNLLAVIVTAPVFVSLTYMGLKAGRRQPISFNDLSFGFTRFFKSIATYILMMLGVLFGVLACIVGSYWVGGRLMLSLTAMVDTDCSPTEALSKSWALTAPFMWIGMLFYFVVGICSVLGVLACCVGFLVSFPLMYICPALVYRDLADPRSTPTYSQPPTTPADLMG